MAVVYLWCRLATAATCTVCLIIIVSQLGLKFNWHPVIFNRRFDYGNATGPNVYLSAIDNKAQDGEFTQGVEPNSTNKDNVIPKQQSSVKNSVVPVTKPSTDRSHPVELEKANRTRFNTVNTSNAYTSKSSKLLWLGNEGKVFADYGEKGCPTHEDGPTFKALLEQWIALARALNITYFLTCGTLLGSYRNSDLIPNDGDVDVIVDLSDYPKLRRRAEARNFKSDDTKLHFVVQEDFIKPVDKRRRFSCLGKEVKHYMDHCSFQEPLGRLIKDNAHVDVYHYIVKGDTVEDPSEGGRILKKADVFPLRRCRFMGLETRCPYNPKALLSLLYTDDLRPKLICKNGEWITRN